MSTKANPKAVGSKAHSRFRASAAGRVNLIGEHVDYCDGFVLPMAIDRRVTLEATILDGRSILLHSAGRASLEIDLRLGLNGRAEPAWGNYVRGVAAGFSRLGYDLPGMAIEVASSVPPGGGLSSSAALEVAAATLFEGVLGIVLEPKHKAALCQRAEHEFAGVPCGIMDQSASVFGRPDHALLLDCRTLEIDPVPMLDPSISILILNTMVKHELGSGAYANRRRSCEEAARLLQVESLRDVSSESFMEHQHRLPELERRRCRHVVSEIERVPAFATAARNRDWTIAGRLMRDSHQSLKNDFEVSCPELDFVAETANARSDVFGCRMTGGGFGGCCVALVQSERAEIIQRELSQAYIDRFGIEPDGFFTRPGEGPRWERL